MAIENYQDYILRWSGWMVWMVVVEKSRGNPGVPTEVKTRKGVDDHCNCGAFSMFLSDLKNAQ